MEAILQMAFLKEEAAEDVKERSNYIRLV